MKEKLTRNIGLKVLSIILAAILWLVITNVDDPVITENFDNVPVVILNEDALTSTGQIYEIIEGETIDFTVAARRSIADNLTASDFKVTVDFAKLSSVNAVSIDVTCPRYGDDVTVTDGQYQMMKVNLEELKDEDFKVKVVTMGEPAKGYFVGEKTASTIMRVSGPKSKIERIADIIVEVDVSEVSESFRTIGEPKALDEEGKEIDASNLTFIESYATVKISIYETKTINLQITVTGEPAKGYIRTNTEYEPKTIEVAGEDEALRSIEYLSITESISGATGNVEKEIDLQDKLPEGIVLVGEDQNITIIITIEKTETKEVMIYPEDIEIRNKLNQIELKYLATGPIAVTVVGPKGKLADITRLSLKPYIDLANYSIGTYSLAVGFDLGEQITLVQNPMVSVYLSQ